MRARRGLLFAGFTLFVVCATHRVGASGPWEAEGGPYGGSVPGHMTCGPDMRIAYGGVGGEIRYSQARAAGQSDGVAFDVGGLVESERAWAVGCNTPECLGDGFSGLAPSGRARIGYDWPGFGFRLGAILWTQPQTGQRLQPVPVPDLALRVGAFDEVRFVLGFGAYDLPTYLRPGLYCGLLVPVGRGWELGGHVGVHYALADSLGFRGAITVRAPLAPHVWLRTDFAVMGNDSGPGSDAVLGLGEDF
ncbi:MAG TPA: hypothetical protein VIJ22_08465 [Polyangiaceae bacterium]